MFTVLVQALLTMLANVSFVADEPQVGRIEVFNGLPTVTLNLRARKKRHQGTGGMRTRGKAI